MLRSNPVTPVKVDRLESLLIGYPVSLKKFLVSGFSHGFRVSFMGERCAFESPNLIKGSVSQLIHMTGCHSNHKELELKNLSSLH